MRNTIRACITLFACLLAANSHAGKSGHDDADSPRHAHHMKHHMPMHRMIKSLDLNADQRQQLKAIQAENREEYRTRFEALRDNHKQLHELIASGNYTEDKAAQLADQHGEIMAGIVRLKTAEMAQLYALLTPEQQKKFKAFEFRDYRAKGNRRGNKKERDD